MKTNPRVWPAPLYTFLRIINSSQFANSLEKKVLDCGAGGTYPPLALFHEHGYETWGIDISDIQIERAHTFCRENRVDLNIIKGDVRNIPFKDESFSFVYEMYTLCHLSKRDTGIAIKEMERVLKRGGLCFLGFMSLDIWPLVGKEVNSGEFYFYEGRNPVVHSLYADFEPDTYFRLDIVYKEKKAVVYHEGSAKKSRKEWADEYDVLRMEEWATCSREEWITMYEERTSKFNWSELYYIVRKPLEP